MSKNTVILLGYYGDDTVISCSAWTSTYRELTPEKRERIPDLLKMLWNNGHHTPFEKGVVHFLCTTDIATHIQLLKHRIGVSINSESARYKELKEDKFYIPEDWLHINVNRNATFEKNKDLHWWLHLTDNKDSDWFKLLKEYTKLGNALYHQCLEDLTPVLGRKRAKESARFFKTYNSQITCDVMFNMRSFGHFYKLRADEHAQLEIQELAKQMLSLIEQIPDNPFETTVKLIKNG